MFSSKFIKSFALTLLLATSFLVLLNSCSGDYRRELDNNNDMTEFEYCYKLLKNFFYYQERLSDISQYDGFTIKEMYQSVLGYFKGGGFTRYYSPEDAANIWGQLNGDDETQSVFLDSLANVPFITVTGFLEITNKSGGTYQEFKDILQEIKGAKAAIIDLRSNPGGTLSHCGKMSAELSPFDKEMFYARERYYDTWQTEHYFPKDFLKSAGDGLETKWIFLTDSMTASASEIFISAVKSTRPEDVVVIGGTTYGKAIGQYYFSTLENGIAGVTAMRFFYPNGDTYNEIGIIPDVEINPKDTIVLYEAALNAAANFGQEISLKTNLRNSKNLPSRNKYPIYKTDFGAYEIVDISF